MWPSTNQPVVGNEGGKQPTGRIVAATHFIAMSPDQYSAASIVDCNLKDGKWVELAVGKMEMVSRKQVICA